MAVFTDQTGRHISIGNVPKRIISIVPSQTELLHDLGLEDEVIGITKFCVHPGRWFQSKKRVGGTKKIKMDIIRQLAPDLIIANKEENEREEIEELEKYYPVYVSDVSTLKNAYEMIDQIGMITDREAASKEIIRQIQENFSGLTTNDSRLPTTYLIWQNPYMTVGGDTFIHSMMMAAGFENIFSKKDRYPEVRIDELLAADCQLLLLSSEPFPFKEKHVEEIRAKGFGGKILIVDGEMFSWYGSRLRFAPGYFKQLHDQLK